jgi:spore germination cell wall hydrolase CwlJ-like protein
MNRNIKKLAFYMTTVSLLTFSLGFTSPKVESKQNASDNQDITGVDELLEKREINLEKKEDESVFFSDANLAMVNSKYRESKADANDRRGETEAFKEIDGYYQVSADYLNVRSEPNPSSKIVDVLVKDWTVTSVDDEPGEGWVALSTGGFINTKYTQNLDKEKAEEVLAKQADMEKPKPVFAQPEPKKEEVQEASVKVEDKPEPKAEEKEEKVAEPEVESQQVTAKEEPQVEQVSTTNEKEEASAPVAASGSDLDLLARLVHAEAKSEPYAGKVAVAKVVLNRTVSGQFPTTIQGVIYQSGQFSPVTNGSINTPASAESTQAAQEAIAQGGSASGDMFFYNPAIATSRWLDSKPTTQVIGNHVFKK